MSDINPFDPQSHRYILRDRLEAELHERISIHVAPETSSGWTAWWTLWEPLPNTPYELPQFQVQTGDGLKAYIRFGGNGVEVITFVGDMMSTGEWIEGRYIELAQSQGTEPGLPAPRHSRVKLPTEHQRRMLLALSHEWRTASELAQIAGIPKKGAGTVPAGPTQPGTR